MNSKRVKAVVSLFSVLFAVQQMHAEAQSQDKKTSLLEFSDQLRDLTERVSKSVVQVVATGYGLMNDQSQTGTNVLIRQRSSGSGLSPPANSGPVCANVMGLWAVWHPTQFPT